MANTYRHTADFAPYFDDWESAKHDDKGYVKVLFKPSVAVQARELNQTQTYLNSQIASLGGYLFKDGTPVSGAKISYVTNQKYAVGTISYLGSYDFEEIKKVILDNQVKDSGSVDIRDFTLTGIPISSTETDEIITNSDESGTTSASQTEEPSYPVIQITGFYDYESPNGIYDETNAGNITELQTINGSGYVTKRLIILYNLYGGKFEENTSYYFTIGNSVSITFETIGKCTTASCTKGVIFVDGYFINVPMSTVLVNPFNEFDPQYPAASFGIKDISNDDVQYNVGFWIERDIVTAYEDTTLTDPASGSYNYKAPGADRYKILGKLCCITDEKLANELDDINNVDTQVISPVKFVTGIVLKNNILIKEQNNVGTNSDLMDEMARRTYEESGSYSVNPWKVQIEDHPTNSSKYVVSVEPGLGYIYGYRVSNVVSQKIENEKSRSLVYKPNNSKYTDASRYTISEDLYTDDLDVVDVNIIDNDLVNHTNNHINLHSFHVENVINSAKCLLIDRQISEVLKVYSNITDNVNNSYTLDFAYSPNYFINNAIIDANTITFNSDIVASVVGEITISTVDSHQTGINLYVNNNQSNNTINTLSSAYSIISIDNNNKITGYVDLKIDEKTKTSIWKNNEVPYIFETDYNYVANTKDAFDNFKISYNSVVYAVSSSFTITSEGETTITFNPTENIGTSPSSRLSIMCLVDSNGKIYSPLSYSISDNTNDSSFNVIITENINGATSFTIYWLSNFNYDNTSTITTSKDLLKSKTLSIDVLHITDMERDLTDSIKLDYDVITLLGIVINKEEYLYNGNILNNNEGSISNFIKLNSNVTDFCYKKSTVTGLKTYIENNNLDVTSIYIIYAYFKHSKNDTGFYCGLSYNASSLLISDISINDDKLIEIAKDFNISTEQDDIIDTDITDADITNIKNNITIYKTRLYNYFGISGLYKSDTEYVSTTGSVSSDIYKIIPTYVSNSGSQYNLANCFDFRQDYDEENTNFVTKIPYPSSSVIYSISLYVPRIDNVWVDKTGNFGITKGIPSENPVAPSEIDGSMTLYRILNRPYGISTSDIIPTYIDNKRHTMKEISKLNERITALEEVVSMSLIEQSAINMQITDDDGTTRYKCGVFTDTFSNFNNCNISDDEWRASIDSVENSIRPYFKNVDWSISPVGTYNDGTITTSSNDASSSNSNKPHIAYKLDTPTSLLDLSGNPITGVICWNDSIITLKPIDMTSIRNDNLTYTTEVVKSELSEATGTVYTSSNKWNYPSEYSYIYAKNINCTETTNVQSLMFATWSGNLTLFPSIDTWVNDLGNVIVSENYEETEMPATIYRSWTTTSTKSTSDTSTETIASGLSVADIKKLYGSDKAATQAGKLHQRVVPVGTKVANAIGSGGVGHWEPAETITTIRSYETVVAETTTETTSYTGSYIANDVATYMEQQDAFMRVRYVEYTLKGMRPNAKIYGTMDGIPLKFTTTNKIENIEQILNSTEEQYNFTTVNEKGEGTGYIIIPEKMPVGTKVIQFFDEEKLATCYADYTANGKTVWNNIDRTYVREWTPVTTQSTVIKEGTPVFTGATRTITATEIFREEDPIAESFYISEDNGIMLEAIDIFFAAKDVSIGVELFIVECENGYPGQTIVPFSRVFVPVDDVQITKPENIVTGSLPKPTTFKFPVPIYLHPKQEYAFIVIAPSYNYEIYTSTLGKQDLVTKHEIKEQPYTGSMFKSQNLRTWTAEQMQDIMFVMYSMKFNTNQNGFYAYFAVDDMMSKRVGVKSTLPNTIEENDNRYSFDMMNLSAGTFTPNMTNIQFEFMSSFEDATSKWIKYNNKQDIFLDRVVKIASNSNYTKQTSSGKMNNTGSTLNIRSILSTGDSNVTPQIDIEDFHGIFSKNIISDDTTLIDGKQYNNAGNYISNSVVLKESATGLKVILDEILPEGSKIKVYYKLTNSDSKYCTATPKNYPSLYINDNTDNTIKQFNVGLDFDRIKDNILNKICYIWYYVYDNKDSSYKFIRPSDTIVNNNSSSYLISSFIPTNIIDNEEYNKIELIVSNCTDVTAFKDGLIEENDDAKDILSYNNNNSSYTLIGVYAIPKDCGMYNQEDFNNDNSKLDTVLNKEYSETNDYYFKTVKCIDYNSDYEYIPGEMCIYQNTIFINSSNMNITNITPSHDSDGNSWEEIPCILLTQSYSPISNIGNGTWTELQKNEYKDTTERQTNFMEYTYTTSENILNSVYFDEFVLKVEMYCQNQCKVPRFRNLRAIAVV